MSSGTHTYRPSRGIRVTIIVTLLVFVAMTVIAIKTNLNLIYDAIAVGMAFFAVLGVVESFVSSVEIEPKTIVIKGLYKTERIAISDIGKVSAEGGRTALLLKAGKWKKLPEWLGANMSARRRIADRIKA
jgi:hypothetical protein